MVGRNLSRSDTMLLENTKLLEDAIDLEEDEEPEPVRVDKSNFVFGMHPLQADNVVIDPNYPPQFYPYLYPHLYPHLFPKLFPHYCKNYEELMKKKKKKHKHERRDIVVVLPDGRNIQMSKKEFLAYQLALAQMGYPTSKQDLVPMKKDPIEFDSISKADTKSVAPSEPDSPARKKKTVAPKNIIDPDKKQSNAKTNDPKKMVGAGVGPDPDPEKSKASAGGKSRPKESSKGQGSKESSKEGPSEGKVIDDSKDF